MRNPCYWISPISEKHQDSAHSAAVQLYTKSDQLPTTNILVEQGKLSSDRCKLRCDDIEDMHHIFMDCRVYEEWRAEALISMVEWMKEKFDAVEVEEVFKNSLLHTAKSLFIDDPLVWPLQKTHFYLGQLPKIDPLISLAGAELREVFRRWLKSHIVNFWNITCICLAGKIFRDFQRRMAVLVVTKSNGAHAWTHSHTSLNLDNNSTFMH